MEQNVLLKKENFFAVDIAKFILAFCVISIHTYYDFFKSAIANTIIGSVIIRFAVPFFFVASGFFFFRGIIFENGKIKKCPENRAKLFGFIKRIFLLYVIWAVIYFAFEAFTYIDANLPLTALVKTYATTFFFKGISRPFWYLVFMIYAIIILYLLLRFLNIKIVGGVVAAIFVLFLYFYTYRARIGTDFLAGVLQKMMTVDIPFIGTRFHLYMLYAALSFLFAGLLCVYLKDKISKTLSGILLLISIVLSIAENVFMDVILPKPTSGRDPSYSLFLLPVALFGFIFLSKIKLKGNPRIFSFFRNGSSFIYCVHMLVIMVFNFLTNRQFDNKPILFFIISGLTLALTLIIVPLSSKLKFLKKLF